MNSTSVIVGAMVVSPLLYPVICIGAATYQLDWFALMRTVATFVTGLFSAVAAAAAVNLFYTTTFHSELVERLSASMLDYFLVAFFSGVAGTYAFYSPKIHEAVAGIAISVALMPPVVMLGIGLAESNASLAVSSVTIVFSNVLGIYAGSFIMVAGLHWMLRTRGAS